jgi:hypothetical protein
MKLRNGRKRPDVIVEASTPACSTSVDVLKKGPEMIPNVIKAGTPWEDKSFEGQNMLFWEKY